MNLSTRLRTLAVLNPRSHPSVVECCVMSLASERLSTFADLVADHQRERVAHRTDDFGWPICGCTSCERKRDAQAAKFIDCILSGFDPEKTFDRNPENEWDHSGDMGREDDDARADNARGAARGRSGTFKPIGDALPTIAAPGIVPTPDDQTNT